MRSQAMIQYRYQSSDKKRKPKEAEAQSIEEFGLPGGAASERDRTPVLLNENVHRSSQDAFLTQWLEEPQERIYNTTSEAWWSVNAVSGNPNRDPGMAPRWHPGTNAPEAPFVPNAAHPSLMRPSRYRHVLAILPKSTYGKRVLSYEDSDAHDAELLDIIAGTVKSSQKLHVTGGGMDPFLVIPQFKNPELNAVFLVRRCNRVFSSKNTLKQWLPLMLSDPHILLSSTVMATCWLDMHAGICGESKRTVLLKQESIGYINERLRDSRAMDDSTLAIIVQILAGEMWSSNEKTIRIHQEGIARLINYRGGLSQLGGYGTVASVAAA